MTTAIAKTAARLFGWNRKKPTPVAVHLRGWNLARWQSSDTSVEWARSLFASDMGQRLLSVLHNELPKGYAHEAGQQLGRINGFLECIAVMERLAESSAKPADEPEATFGAPETDDDPLMTEQP